MRKKSVEKENGSFKTLFIYAVLVFALITISLVIKAFFIFQQSKFDGQHLFTIAIAKNGKVGEILAFNPSDQSTSLLTITQSNVPLSSLYKIISVVIDAKIDSNSDIPIGTDVTQTITYLIFHFNNLKTDLTVYDLGRFLVLSKNLQVTSLKTKNILLPMEDDDLDTNISGLFTNTTFSTENISIQIINATDISGVGKRLERLLVNMGGNVVSVTTAKKKEQKSIIKYYDKETYTLKKLENFLQFPTMQLANKTIADVTIVIGEDALKKSSF
jgi:hypothetical protein